MNDPLSELARLIESRSGFVIPERGRGSLAEFIQSRSEALRLSGIDQYVEQLRGHEDSHEWRQLMSSITVKESFLFRGRAQFDALERAVLPQLAEQCRDRRLRVWCAGCARGEEAASLAIVLAECEALAGWNWTILATDVDDTALADARRGIFGRRAMEAVSPKRRDLHFLRRDESYQLVPELLSRIQFLRLNLAQPPLEPPGAPFNLVFLRNVLIYFRPGLQRRVVASVEAALDTNGWLFLGPSESLLPLGVSLKARDLGDAFCYGWPPETTAEGVVSKRRDIAVPVATEAPRKGIAKGTEGELALSDRIEPIVAALAAGSGMGALRMIEGLRREYPDDSVVRVLEGVAKASVEDAEGAVLAFRAALYLSPELFEARFLLARVFDSLHRLGRAQKEYRSVVAILESSNRETGAVFSRIGVPERDEILRHCIENVIEKET